ncbi:acetolactate synthase small subunit, partial [Streptomyces turgidiscabies]|uniref:acetolactate synthase small subunit n=1 Tax=Streptomyces turgidiscabies TaxID=85558 RepID=UPI0038F5E05E
GRGYNIESLTVSETEHEAHLSRITILTKGTPMVIEQIKNQLARLVNVHRVIDLTVAGDPLERELALIKVAGKGEKRIEALRLADRTPICVSTSWLSAELFPDAGNVFAA